MSEQTNPDAPLADQRIARAIELQDAMERCANTIASCEATEGRCAADAGRLRGDGTVPDSDELVRRRQVVSASLAMQQITKEEANTALLEIDGLEKKSAGRAAKVKALNDLAAGSKHIRSTAQQELELLAKEHARGLIDILTDEIETAGATYAKAAKEVSGAYAKLRASIVLRHQLGGSIVSQFGAISLPGFALESCAAAAKDMKSTNGVLFAPDHFGAGYSPLPGWLHTLQSELERRGLKVSRTPDVCA